MAPKTGNSKPLPLGMTYLRNSSGYINIFGGAQSKGRMSDTDR